MNIELEENEVIHSLDINNLKIVQNKNGFCFGMDSVLLSDFAKEIKNNSSVLELCSGNAAISILLSAKTKDTFFTTVEIQEYVSNLASKSVILNDLQNRFKILNMDLKELDKIYKSCSFDAIVCNPPYKKISTGILNNNDTKTIARHEIYCSLEDIARISSFLLKDNCSLYMVHRPERLCDVIYTLRMNNLEPKLLRFIQPQKNKPSNLFLIKAVKCGKPFLKLLENLIVYDETGKYTKEFLKIYNMM